MAYTIFLSEITRESISQNGSQKNVGGEIELHSNGERNRRNGMGLLIFGT